MMHNHRSLSANTIFPLLLFLHFFASGFLVSCVRPINSREFQTTILSSDLSPQPSATPTISSLVFTFSTNTPSSVPAFTSSPTAVNTVKPTPSLTAVPSLTPTFTVEPTATPYPTFVPRPASELSKNEVSFVKGTFLYFAGGITFLRILTSMLVWLLYPGKMEKMRRGARSILNIDLSPFFIFSLLFFVFGIFILWTSGLLLIAIFSWLVAWLLASEELYPGITNGFFNEDFWD